MTQETPRKNANLPTRRTEENVGVWQGMREMFEKWLDHLLETEDDRKREKQTQRALDHGPIQVEWVLPEREGFIKKFSKTLAKLGIAVGLSAGGGHLGGTMAEGWVGDKFIPIHDSLNPVHKKEETITPPNPNTPTPSDTSIWDRVRDVYQEAGEKAKTTAKDLANKALDELQIMERLDAAVTSAEGFLKEAAYWSAFVVTMGTILTLLTAWVTFQKLTGRKEIPPGVEEQLRELQRTVNLLSEKNYELVHGTQALNAAKQIRKMLMQSTPRKS